VPGLSATAAAGVAAFSARGAAPRRAPASLAQPLRPAARAAAAGSGAVVLTIPRLLRPLFRCRRELLSELARAGAEATVELLRRATGEDLRPGLVASLDTAGDLLQWHPHLHLLTTDGGFGPDGRFYPLSQWDAMLLMSLLRERLLAQLLDRHAISQELVHKLLAWRHPGFSTHVGEPIEPQDKQRLGDTAAYLVRNPLSLKKLVYLDGHKAVLYRSRMNPSLTGHASSPRSTRWIRSSALAAARRCRPSPSSQISSRSEGFSTTSDSAQPKRPNPRPSRSPSASPSRGRVGECRRTGESELATATRGVPLPWITSSDRGPVARPRPPASGSRRRR
jgi:hypothetical protein